MNRIVPRYTAALSKRDIEMLQAGLDALRFIHPNNKDYRDHLFAYLENLTR